MNTKIEFGTNQSLISKLEFAKYDKYKCNLWEIFFKSLVIIRGILEVLCIRTPNDEMESQ
jgi:hypothetical protein